MGGVLEVIRKISIDNANYDLVLYCPIEFPIPDDGLRSLNVDFQKTVDTELRKLLKELEIKFHELSGNEKQRLEKALKLIKNIKKS